MNGLPPVEPSADMRQGALATRGLYLAYVEAGFSEQEALCLIGIAIFASIRGDS